MIIAENPVIILSRTDSIGDVVLTLPMAGFLKKHLPGCRIIFLGRTYTRPIIGLSSHVDEFINFDELERLDVSAQSKFIRDTGADIFIHVFPRRSIAMLAKKAGIRQRIGTTNRIYHWFTCNRLVKLSRKNSSLHESQLNMKLLGFAGADTTVNFDSIPDYYGIKNIPKPDPEYEKLIDNRKSRIVLHPRSRGSAREWGTANFSRLIQLLPEEKYQVFITGTAEDAESMGDFLRENERVVNLCGRLSLEQLIAFISRCQVLVAASTGPLHIAAALGIKAIGLFSPKRPIHPGRWKPAGKQAFFLADEDCAECARGRECKCISRIAPEKVLELMG